MPECLDLSVLDSKQVQFGSLLPSFSPIDGHFNSEDQAVALADSWPSRASLLAPGFGVLNTAGCEQCPFFFCWGLALKSS